MKNLKQRECKDCGCTDDDLFYPANKSMCKNCLSIKNKEKGRCLTSSFF